MCTDRNWGRPRKYFQVLTLSTFGGLLESIEEKVSHNFLLMGYLLNLEGLSGLCTGPGSIYLPKGGIISLWRSHYSGEKKLLQVQVQRN